MNFLQRNKTVSVIIAVFCILSLCAFLLPSFTRTVTTTLAKPIWILRDSAFTISHDFFSYFKSKNTLIQENNTLHTELAALELKNFDYDVIMQENQNFKSLSQSRSEARTIARVISKPPQSPYDTYILSIGSSDGAVLGAHVFLSDVILLGTVTDVTPHTAVVTLFSNNGQKTTVEDTRTGVSFEALGRGGANLSITVPKETDVIWGDNFAYPSISSEIIGTVYYIDTAGDSSFKTVYMRIPGNIFSSQWVSVEKNI